MNDKYSRSIGRFSLSLGVISPLRDGEQHPYQCDFGYREINGEHEKSFHLSIEELRDIKHAIDQALAALDRWRMADS